MERSFHEGIRSLRLGAGETFHGAGILALTKALLLSGVSYIGGYQGAPVSHLLDVMVQARSLGHGGPPPDRRRERRAGSIFAEFDRVVRKLSQMRKRLRTSKTARLVERPRGMDQRTFEKLCGELDTLVALSTIRLAESLGVERLAGEQRPLG